MNITDDNLRNAAVLKRRLEAIRTAAEESQGVMQQIIDKISHALVRGGTASIQPQVMFLYGALARMQKDLGVVEHVQAQGAAVKPVQPELRKSLFQNGKPITTARQ